MDTPAPNSLRDVMTAPEIQEHLRKEEARVSQEVGYDDKADQFDIEGQFQKPFEHEFTADQRPHTTLLFGGFTFRHELLIQAVFESLGYKSACLPTPNTDAFQTGKEYGNNGQCNPTYFTVGNLVQFLQNLRDEHGMTTEYIEEHYIFLTAGSCGPCRFGMYEAEYRLALRNAGFEKFRVMLFQQKGGLTQSDVEAGLKLDADFFMGLVSAINMGDLLNEFTNQVRPYEATPGAADRTLYEGLQYLYTAVKSRKGAQLQGKAREYFDKRGSLGTAELALKFVDLLTTEDYSAPLREVARQMDEVELDRLQPKPVVKITGEFWAQTTDGDGNFNMFKFLQGEGAEVITEPIASWLNYLLWQTATRSKDRRGLDEGQADPKWWEVGTRAKAEMKFRKQQAAMKFASWAYRHEYDRMREALGGTTHKIVDMYEMERIAHEFYHSRSEGGEGHLEVAKNIYYTVKGIAHMVLSLKPFGCMPSTQSDGAQSAVVNRFKDMIYLPIETSGEGEINAHSRVQMALGEAKAKAKAEFREVVAATGYTLDELRAYVDQHRDMKRPLYHVPEYEGVVGTGARFAKHVGERMQAEGIRPGSLVETAPAAE